MDWFYPSFAPLDLGKFAAGEASAPPGDTIRFHLVRSTEYGDRYKLYRVATPDTAAAAPETRYGVKIGSAEGGGYEIVDVAFNGLAEQAGIKIGDAVTEVDVEQVGLPSKYLVYPFALFLLGLVFAMQIPRWRRAQQEAAPADGG
jgi:hypothetical protein